MVWEGRKEVHVESENSIRDGRGDDCGTKEGRSPSWGFGLGFFFASE